MFDLIVIGGGPSGMMASIIAAKNGKKVLLLEKNSNLGKKLLLTGGGRCNLTNLKQNSLFENELSDKISLHKALSIFGPKEIFKYFESLNVKLKTEDNDRVFPVSNKSSSILNALLNELHRFNVDIHCNETVLDIKCSLNSKIITTSKNKYTTQNIIIATGGCSYSNTGSAGDGFKFAELLKQPVTETYPVETSIILKNAPNLAGLTLELVNAKFNNIIKTGSLLFTHKGLSGPVIQGLSEYVYFEKQKNNECHIYIDLLPNITNKNLLDLLNSYNQKLELKSFIRTLLPKKLADYLISICNVEPTKKLASISKVDRNIIIELVKNLPFEIEATTQLEDAFITGGGIDFKYINEDTMESKITKGLYFVGELLDIHGPIGGYNITIALSTGYTAGNSII